MANKFIDPLTDFGFKRLFGSEPDKEIMIAFLNALFEGEKVIEDVSYAATEYVGEHAKEKKVLFDLTCRGRDGESFVIEMQRTDQEFFRERCVFYMSRLISALLPRGSGNWDVPLKEVYLIGIMEFQFNNINDAFLHNIALMNRETHKIFYKGMGFKFLELPNFDKKESELETELDKWFYLLKNLSRLNKIPDFLDKRVFQKIFKIAEMSKFTKEELELYHSDVKAKSDWNAGIRFAEKKAEAKGLATGKLEGKLEKALEIARTLKEEGFSEEQIVKITQLGLEEIKAL